MLHVPVRFLPLLLVTPAVSAGISRAELLERPPFAAPKTSAGNESGTVEFTGVFGAGDDIEISLREPGGRAAWVRLRDPDARHFIEKITEDHTEITLVTAGMRHVIRLRKEAPPAPKAEGEAQPDAEPEQVIVGPGPRAPDDPGLKD